MIKVQPKEKSFYQGKEFKVMCYACTEDYVTTSIIATDKYNQNHELGLCDSCKKELIEGLAKLG